MSARFAIPTLIGLCFATTGYEVFAQSKSTPDMRWYGRCTCIKFAGEVSEGRYSQPIALVLAAPPPAQGTQSALDEHFTKAWTDFAQCTTGPVENGEGYLDEGGRGAAKHWPACEFVDGNDSRGEGFVKNNYASFYNRDFKFIYRDGKRKVRVMDKQLDWPLNDIGLAASKAPMKLSVVPW